MKRCTETKCRLCGAQKPLQRSHIVSEFIYKPLYNSKHQLFALSGTTKADVLQKGARERLLCRDCEQQFSRYENYAAKTLFSANPGGTIKGPLRWFSGLRYPELKLFLMSLLWRFAETSLPMLTGAQLGPHRERLRACLKAEDPGDHLTYPCMITEVTMNGRTLRQWIIPPKRSRVEGHAVWNAVIGGYLMSFFVSSHCAPWQIEPALLHPRGSLGIYSSDIRKIPSLLEVARRLSEVEL